MTKFDAKDFAEWVDTVRKARPSPVATVAADSTERPRYLTPAAVLAEFRVDGLQSEDGPLDPQAVRRVLDGDLVPIPGAKGRYTLTSAARTEGLGLLVDQAVRRRTRDRQTPDETSVLQRVFDGFLFGDFSAAQSQDPAELEAATHALEWIKAVPALTTTGLPDERQLHRTLVSCTVLSRMRRLAEGFVGRATELEQLRAFVGVIGAQTIGAASARALSSLFKGQGRRPLFIHGIGGIGKSALLSQFVLEHATGQTPFPWVYLDFDAPALSVNNLPSIVVAAADQLSAQYAGSDWSFVYEAAADYAALSESADYDSRDAGRTLDVGDAAVSQSLRDPALDRLAATFATAVRAATSSTTLEQIAGTADSLPLLLVLDTFEEVQKRGVEQGATLWRFLGVLRHEHPRLRVVFASRAPAPDLKIDGQSPEPLQLTEFDRVTAILFLAQQGIGDKTVAGALFSQVGGSPLTLKLAAQVAKEESAGATGLAGISRRSYFVLAASGAVVQGQLYTRILDRIQDPDLRRLAHPGLVVRRLTPAIIRHVLAEPCGLGPIDDARALDLFNSLAMQAGLVVTVAEGVLQHQPELRASMVKQIEQSRPVQVRQIHEGALKFYGDQLEGPLEPADRAIATNERLFHALKLGRPEKEIDAFWSKAAGDSALESVDELPDASKITLLLKTGGRLPPELRRVADAVQWEAEVEPRAREAIQHGDIEMARALLAERKTRESGSRLLAIDAFLAVQAKQYRRAEQILNRAIAQAEERGRREALIELLRLRGDLYATTKRLDQSEASLSRAQELAKELSLPVLELQILLDRVRAGRPPSVADLESVLPRVPDTDFASLQLHLQGLFSCYATQSDLLLRKGVGAFVLLRASVERTSPGLLPLVGEVRGQVNQRLLELLVSRPDDRSFRAQLGTVLEASLDPLRAQRAQ